MTNFEPFIYQKSGIMTAPDDGTSEESCGSDIGNIKEYVRVPNTEFVALIVGRGGYKIKAIRERTKTFIKTPLKDEPPVFLIVGNKTDVMKAKKEIIDIVETLDLQRHRYDVLKKVPLPDGENRITISFRVPFRLVGLVVGFEGGTIQEIQLRTNTSIRTPDRGAEPIFLITGSWKDVYGAKKTMQNFIMNRTGFYVEDFETLFGEKVDPIVLNFIYNNSIGALLNLLESPKLMDSPPTPDPFPIKFNAQNTVQTAASLTPLDTPHKIPNFWENLEMYYKNLFDL